MTRVITIDPGKIKCGLVLAQISEKKVEKASPPETRCNEKNMFLLLNILITSN